MKLNRRLLIGVQVTWLLFMNGGWIFLGSDDLTTILLLQRMALSLARILPDSSRKNMTTVQDT